MSYPAYLDDKYGQPENVSDRWVAWFHRCPQETRIGRGKQYPMLLLSLLSGWLNCKACGFKQHVKGAGAEGAQQRVTKSMAEAVEQASAFAQALRPASEDDLVWQYLTETRNLTQDEISHYGILTGTTISHLYQYAVVPIYEEGDMVSWHARDCRSDLGDNDPARTRPRWLSPAADDKCYSRRTVVWGIDRVTAGEDVYLCEGMFDAMFFDRGLAYMGPVPTEVQVRKIVDREPGRIVICSDWDTDPDDIAKAIRRTDRYVPVVDWREAKLPKLTAHAKDYGELLKAGMRWADNQTCYYLRFSDDDAERWWLDMED